MEIFKSGGWEHAYSIIIVFFIFLWIVSIIRVAKDISARTNSILLHVISILFITFLTPIIGLPVYHIIKPIGYKKDKIPRREAFLTNSTTCKHCGMMNAKEYYCCINCGKKLLVKCKECSTEYPHSYQYCYKCGGPNIELK